MKRIILILAVSVISAVILSAAEPYQAFLDAHCLRCHGPKKAKGDLRIDQLSRDFGAGIDAHHWAEIVERINAGEMPPEDEDQPSENEIATVVPQLNDRIREGRAARMAARPVVAHYRLSRGEFQHTVYDLLGVRYDTRKPGELTADPLWHGYDRIGSLLSLSPSHVERYYRAAEIVLARAFPDTPVEPQKVRMTAADLRYGGGKNQQAYLDRFGIKRPLRALVFPGRTLQALRPNWFGRIGPEKSGLYRARMQVSGIRPQGGQPAHLRIGTRTDEATNEGLIELDILAPEDEPEIIEFEVFLEMPASLDFNVIVSDIISRDKGGHHRNILGGSNYMFTHTSETRLLNPTGPKLFDEDGNGIFSFVLVDWIEWEGPLESPSERATRDELLPFDDASPEMVAQCLQRFAERAWRRPVNQVELSPYLKAYADERAEGEELHAAYKVALLGLLTSRNFTYLVEGDVEPRERLTDWELASRLSYFLWSSMPDAALVDAARAGKLTGDGFAAQVDRMLASPKIARFIDDFPRQWLQLHRLGMFQPDSKLYPDYDAWLEASMREEVVEFYREVFTSNLPIDAFLRSDWTVANPRLCEFYGLPEPAVSGFQRVTLRPEHHRGGLLTMGAVLGLTSDGTRHRPVHRGVWLSEAIFGKTPPPPPANVDPIEPNPPDSPKATIREKLEAHAVNPNCAACHRGIDPLGLAFDQFDAIGQWRTHERVPQGMGADPLVNPSGTLPDGRTFADAESFKHLLLADREIFLRAFVEQLCTYGLRRVLTFDDREDLEIIVDEAMQKEYRLRDIIRAVALSDLIQKR
ncbi:MAG: mono/diheme cytochrome c family protein [Candidatus Omnitrophota bacterium]|jgi:mono/diheme cytochrome c family protein